MGDATLPPAADDFDAFLAARGSDTANLPALIPTADATVAARAAASPLSLVGDQDALEFIELRPDDIEYALSKEMDLATCRRLRVIPVEADPVEIVLALADMTDWMLLDDLRVRFSPREVRFVAADGEAIDTVISRWSALAAKEAEHAAVLDLSGDVGDAAEEAEANDDNGRMAQLLSRLLEQAVTAGASDVHFEPGEEKLVVRFRVDGVLSQHDEYPIGLANGIVNRLKVMSRINIAERRVPQDGRFHRVLAGHNIDCRVVTIPTAVGVEGAVVRLLDQSRSRLTLTDVGFADDVQQRFLRVLENPHGMILVVGPTGSGKTTTLYAALGMVARSDRKVLTVEDPVEIRFPMVTQVQVDERAGLSFSSALRSFLRADPDIILVGEIRDRETAALAAQASLTGHLVLSTLHANEASGAPTRLVNMGLEGFVVASSLKAVLAQRLLRRLCQRCAEPYLPSAEELAALGWDESGLPVPERLWRPSGDRCDHCLSRGYRGRLVVAELLEVDEVMADAIANVAPAVEIERCARAAGAASLHRNALGWLAEGVTSVDELRRVGT